MNAETTSVKLLIAAFLASVLGVHPLYWVLLVLVIIDFATGLLVGFVKRNLSAKTCKDGIARKRSCCCWWGPPRSWGKALAT